jgi:hypothetical protein
VTHLYGFAVKSKPWEITHLAEKLDDDRYRDVISGHAFTPSKYPQMFVALEMDTNLELEEIGKDDAYDMRKSLTDTLMRATTDYVPPKEAIQGEVGNEQVDWEEL